MISAVNEFLDDLRGGRMMEAPIVTVDQGQLQGKVVTSPTGKSYYSFQGIPYAKPPLGSLRFQAPQPPEPWDGIRDATSEGCVSAQVDPYISKSFTGDENCLFLNVYTTNLDGAFLPVMIYIHGGGFRFGSGNSNFYGADFLVEKDVVIVTLNYRCGALGFLSLNTSEVPGNAGIKDIIQAIRWVKENIQNFGGNPGNVTVFGESAGGVAVSLLTASPLTKNLISKAIIQSGTALTPWAFQKNPIENAKTLAKALGCDSEDVDDILDFLRATSAKEIVEAYESLGPHEDFAEKGVNLFGLVVEKEFPNVESVINEAFINLLTSGRVANIPIMIGSTTLEFAFERKSDDLQHFIPEELHIERNSGESLSIVEKIKSLYFKGSHTSVDSLEDYFQLVSDKLINIGTHRYINYLVQVTNKPIYYYKFDYVGELNISTKLIHGMGLKHAMHMDELGYIFKNDFQKDVEPTPQDLKMRERMVRLWTNFAKTGNPTPDESHYLPVTWLPVTKDVQYYINLGSELSLGTNPDKEKMAFWDDLYSKYFRIWEQTESNMIEAPRKPDVVESVIETVVITTQVISQDGQDIRITEELITTAPELPTSEPPKIIEEPLQIAEEPAPVIPEPAPAVPEPVPAVPEPAPTAPELEDAKSETFGDLSHVNGSMERKVRTSNEIKMVQNSNGAPRDVIRANDPPEDDLPKNIGVNKFVNFFESLGGKK
ncbi:hypothetical protein K1T71_000954 [Dendrolimus kikuchii]|uniref:Uncharacterized protein n=1 Tax=Dendrolimus kikuchii TaxID=765133 RepID=A0ACC1DG99_9NEOP|nr:hypothetical protein K1T71_000954 [Dendrolimus kikuchii]